MYKLFDLTGQTAIITGAGKGLGESFAHALAASGANLFLISRTGSELEKVCEDIRKEHGTRCEYQVADVTDEEQVKSAIDKCIEIYGKIEILINGAAAMRHNKTPEETTSDMYRKVLEPNILGLYNMCREVGKHMIEAKYGRIVNMSSLSAIVVNRGVHGGEYEVSKAAVSMLTKTLATEWAQYGINVNAIAPGYFGTQPNLDFFAADPEFLPKVLEMIPMGRIAQPEELWGTLILLCSPAASYMQGSIISVDGGYTSW